MMPRTISALIGLFAITLISSTSASVPEGWTDNHASAMESAAKGETMVLLMFTGSDWCIWCKRLHAEILDTPVFMDWAKDNLELVYVDFPREDYQSESIKLQNQRLDEQYDVSGYPTVILVDPKGKELTRLSYMHGGPKTFIRAIKRAISKRTQE